jgi:hypothetical protein
MSNIKNPNLVEIVGSSMADVHVRVYASLRGAFPTDKAEMLAALTFDMIASVNLQHILGSAEHKSKDRFRYVPCLLRPHNSDKVSIWRSRVFGK